MNLLVIHELDHEDNDQTVIGVADSVENAELLITEYYGDGNFKDIFFNDIRDSNLEYSKLLEIEWHNSEPTKVTITLEWFSLNKL